MLKKFAFTLITLFLFFIFIEGLFATIHIVHTFYSKVRHSAKPSFPAVQYDEELGWVPIPNLNHEDQYGPGKSLRTNSQGFRAEGDYDFEVPVGKTRIIASGDSMTFGHAVDDNHAWPKLFESLDERLQVVNLAVSGYGVDQIYLRTERDGRLFERQLHIFALIINDIERMGSLVQNAKGKPKLTIENNELILSNVPVPKFGFLKTWLHLNLNLFQESRTIQVLSQAYNKILPSIGSSEDLTTQELEKILKKLLHNLNQSEKDRGSALVVVLLPMERDYSGQGKWHKWQRFLRNETANQGIYYISLFEEFRKLTTDQMEALFYDSDDYHYGKDGNVWAAKLIYEKLLKHNLLQTTPVN